MWNRMPPDVLSHIFSFLSPPSLARASATCTHWRSCAKSSGQTATAPWFLAFPGRRDGSPPLCHALDPESGAWHCLDLGFLPCPIRPVAALVNGLLLCRLAPRGGSPLRLALCNPFTRQLRVLPCLRRPRSSPAVGVVPTGEIYVAGGMSPGGAYEPTVEVFGYWGRTSTSWEVVGGMPVEIAVRLTVWTPRECMYAEGTLYWMTSARAYSVVGFDVAEGSGWREVRTPMAERLEWAALVGRRSGRVGLVGGEGGGEASVWELEGEEWRLVGSVLMDEEEEEEEEGVVMKGRKVWGCVGADGVMYLFRDLCSKMLVWRRTSVGGGDGEEGEWEWGCVEGKSGGGGDGDGKGVPITGALLHPCLSPLHIHSCFAT